MIFVCLLTSMTTRLSNYRPHSIDILWFALFQLSDSSLFNCVLPWLTWDALNKTLQGIPAQRDIGTRNLFSNCEHDLYPNIRVAVKSSTLKRVGFVTNGIGSQNDDCARKYPVAITILFPMDENLSQPIQERAPRNLLRIISDFFYPSQVLPRFLKLASFSLLTHLKHRNILCNNHKLQFKQSLVQYISISYPLPFCSLKCEKNFSVLNYLPTEAENWISYASRLNKSYSVVLTQFKPSPSLEEQHSMIENAGPWRGVRSADDLETDMDSGSGFIDDTPKLELNKTLFQKSVQIPEGQYFRKCITKEALLLNGIPVAELGNFKFELTKTPPSDDQESWIYWNDRSHCVEGLPMSAQEGFNRFYMTCTYKFNQLITLKGPLEILVFKNKILPNHKFGFRLSYNFDEFRYKIHIKLDVLSQIAQVIERNISELTVDQYSHVRGSNFFELWITVHSVGYLPCSDKQLTKIQTYFSRLAGENFDLDRTLLTQYSGVKPSNALTRALAKYNLHSINATFLGPCVEKVALFNEQGGSAIASSLPPAGTSGSSDMQRKSIFSSPIVFVVIIATVVLIVAIVLVRARSNDSCLRRRRKPKNIDTRNFAPVKTKNPPVVFAEEIVDLQSGHMKSYKMNHKHNGVPPQQGGQASALSVCSVCSSDHTPPPPPPPAAPAMPSDEQMSQLYVYQNSSSGNSFTLPMSRSATVDVANHTYSTLNNHNHVNNFKSASNYLVNNNVQNANYHQMKSMSRDSEALQSAKTNGTLRSDEVCDEKRMQRGQHFNELGNQAVQNYNSQPLKNHVSMNAASNGVNGPASYQSDSPRSSSSSSFRQMTALAEIQGQQMQQNLRGMMGANNHHVNTFSPSSANSPSSDLNFNDHSSDSPAGTWASHSPNQQQPPPPPPAPMHHQAPMSMCNGSAVTPNAQYTAVVGSGTNKVAGIQLLGPGTHTNSRHPHLPPKLSPHGGGSGSSSSPVAVLFNPSMELEV